MNAISYFLSIIAPNANPNFIIKYLQIDVVMKPISAESSIVFMCCV